MPQSDDSTMVKALPQALENLLKSKSVLFVGTDIVTISDKLARDFGIKLHNRADLVDVFLEKRTSETHCVVDS